ncbi:MAG: BatD family protein [Chromatocurvus sp.]
MMKKSGKRFGAAWLGLVCLLPTLALATLTAEVDRTRIRLGDSLQLTLSSTGAADPASAELSPLARDFEILQRSSRSSTQIVNGTTTREKALVVDLVPRRAGNVEIPALFADGERTQPIALEVEEATADAGEERVVSFTASVDSDSVYVQQQIILTLTLEQGIALDDRSVTELDLDNAYVKPLGQNSYQRSSGGRRRLVHEIRYAVFPEQSGTLTIPAQTFAGRARRGSRSLFDLDSGRRITRDSEAITIEVRPRPSSFPDTVWLPASELEIEESWSREPDDMTTGDSVTRTVTVTATGLQGAQLPPLDFPDLSGFKYYPDKPSIEEAEADTGIVGLRTDSAALVPVRPGVYRIPEVRIPWWDTEKDRLRYAVLPGREISVKPAAGGGDRDEAGTGQAPPQASTPGTGPQPSADAARDSNLWPWISGLLGLGWLLTAGALAWVLWSQRRSISEQVTAASVGAGNSEPAAWKQVQAACAAGAPGPAREALRHWLQTLPAPACQRSLLEFASAQPGAELAEALHTLDAALYGPTEARAWRGDSLLAAAQAARRRCVAGSKDGAAAGAAAAEAGTLPPLYPTR